MPDEALAFLISLVAGLVATPLAIRVGHRYRLFDYPGGWKRQARPTPYVGGGAVMLAFFLGALTVGGELSRFWPLLAIAAVLGAVGMIDDRSGLSASVRILIEICGATYLWGEGLGWSVFSSDAANLILTNLWVVAVINAMNLLDLMDGVAGTVAGVASAGVGVLAAVEGDQSLAILAFALSGSCAGFLPSNLRSPARVYLGDGGSMAIGFVLAATIANLSVEAAADGLLLAGAIPLFGVPLFDMALRIVLRRRRGIALMTGGPDSVANLLEARLGSPRKVALALGGAQAVLSACAIEALRAGDGAVVALTVLCLVIALVAARGIITSSWAREPDLARPQVSWY